MNIPVKVGSQTMASSQARLPSGQNSRELKITFPKELGTIMVSYSKPMVQTLKAGKVATGYRQAL